MGAEDSSTVISVASIDEFIGIVKPFFKSHGFRCRRRNFVREESDFVVGIDLVREKFWSSYSLAISIDIKAMKGDNYNRDRPFNKRHIRFGVEELITQAQTVQMANLLDFERCKERQATLKDIIDALSDMMAHLIQMSSSTNSMANFLFKKKIFGRTLSLFTAEQYLVRYYEPKSEL